MVKDGSFNIWLSFLKKRGPIYAVGIVAVLLTNIAQVATTRIFGFLVDFFSSNKLPSFFNFDPSLPLIEQRHIFVHLFWLLLGTRFLLTLGRFGWRITLARQTHHSSSFLREKIWESVAYFKLKDLDRGFTKGVLMNNSNSDVNSARFLFGFSLIALIDVVFLGVFTFWAMLTINVELSMVSLIVLFYLPIIIKKLTVVEIKKYEDAQEHLSQFDDLTSQSVSSIRLQRITQTGKYWVERLIKRADQYRNKRLSAVFTNLMFIPVMGAATFLSFLVLFVMGIGYTLNGTMSIGDFVAMQGLIVLLQDPLGELGFIISEWRKGFTSLDRLNKIYLNEKDSSLLNKGTALIKQDYILEVEHLGFNYDHGKEIIKDLSFSMNQGDRLGIKGPIGAGKSTLVKLLAGFEREHRGVIKFHGKSYDEYSHIDLRKGITLVPQKPFLFAGPIRQNVGMDYKLSDQEIWYFLELADLKSDVEGFKEGLDTELGEWGINLSGGQKQRLTLARALARKPEFLLLDDCLSAVDTVTEEKILKNLDRELSDSSLIWVAHRDSTLKYCNKILAL
ncbi:MAG: ABC transporter ATP-binding protein [Deltaproteobacteria bacterium]|nr:MAG: ABC transporter ATP-binding protein [Deltaproteobacteria bacterium]